jgi:asparagine synthase (glutamine-hydrolysing)
MSVQFGTWNLDDKPVNSDDAEKVRHIVAPYVSEHTNSFVHESGFIHFHAFHTTKESRSAIQPYVSPSTVVTWDGRLDNRAELIRELRGAVATDGADVAVVATAYEKWSTASFGKLLGDWALVIWERNQQRLVLAKDFVGTRHLYYSVRDGQVTWNTILDPLVLLAGTSFSVSDEYIAGSLSFFPDAASTPFVGIFSVPPSCYVLVEKCRRTIRKYWDFDPGARIRYATDAEYEEHFRSIFRQSVRRRLCSDTPVLAELSGGMDSSSIVCMADSILAEGTSETPRLDTLSYYDDAEPGWDDRPYFELIERKRGVVGHHISVGSRSSFQIDFTIDRFSAVPLDPGYGAEFDRQFASSMKLRGNRVLLSGLGGDQVTGGVPTPLPELCDLLATGQIRKLATKLKLWALQEKRPWFHLLWEASARFLPSPFAAIAKHERPAPWLSPQFVKRHRPALCGYERRCEFFGPLPSYRDNLSALERLRRQLACEPTDTSLACERRYPYLDRSLLEFLYAIPREQIVRPGQRRFLMRRSLVGIVPDEILNRKRKAFVARAPMVSIATNWSTLAEVSQQLISARLGIVAPDLFLCALRKAREGREVPLVFLLRTLTVEAWLRTLNNHGLLSHYGGNRQFSEIASAAIASDLRQPSSTSC